MGERVHIGGSAGLGDTHARMVGPRYARTVLIFADAPPRDMPEARFEPLTRVAFEKILRDECGHEIQAAKASQCANGRE